MPPKKAQKMSLNEFLGDSTLGSWADEMDALPTAPAARSDEDRSRLGDRRRDDYLSSRPDRGLAPMREDLPLPTEPPFTAFVGNLAFDLTEKEIEDFFAGHELKSVKVIKDRDEKPKGFGYVEFATLDGLKDALSKSGTPMAGRAVRISVAEPPKERSGFGGGGGFDDDKFSGNWRREGPLPDLPSRGDGPRRRFDGPSREPPPSTVSDNISDWRSSRAPARGSPSSPPAELDPGFKRRGSGFRNQDGGSQGPADSDDVWTKGSKFVPSAPSEERTPGSRFGSVRGGRSDMGPPREPTSPAEEDTWRRPSALSRNSTSPNSSVPPTPQMTRRKLELLPRSNASASPSPLASPNPANAAAKTNPFGAARPVDTLSRDAAVAERLEKEREQVKERVAQHPMSRTSSHTASQRGEPRPSAPSTAPTSPKAESARNSTVNANVRPSFSFASAAAGKKDASSDNKDDVEALAEKVDDIMI